MPASLKNSASPIFPKTDIDAACAFYTSVLGMRVSDWSEHQMSFLRCNSEHHVIAFNQAAWTSVNHVAYELSTIDHFMRGLGKLKHVGIDPEWGPGRHGPGDNTFSYFYDPLGNVMEYTTELEQIPDEETWEPRVFELTPENSDQWGTANPMSEFVAKQSFNDPDRGVFVAPPVWRRRLRSSSCNCAVTSRRSRRS